MQQAVTIKNQRGLLLASVFHLPDSLQKSFPAVILLHGFTGYKEEEHLVALAEKLEKNNIAALRFDASGFGESEGTLKNDYRVSNYLSDINAIYQFLSAHPKINSQKIGIWGHSLGAKLALIFGAQQYTIKAICAVSPPLSLRQCHAYQKLIPVWRKQGVLTKVSTRYHHISIPFDFVLDEDNFSLEKYAHQLRQNKLIIIGNNDTTVLPSESQEVFNLLPPPKKLLTLNNLGHDYKKYPQQISLVNSLAVKFFQENSFSL